jgi:hypothetical protein
VFQSSQHILHSDRHHTLASDRTFVAEEVGIDSLRKRRVFLDLALWSIGKLSADAIVSRSQK